MYIYTCIYMYIDAFIMSAASNVLHLIHGEAYSRI